MRTITAELSQRIRSGIEEAVDALRSAAGGDLDAGELTALLGVAFSHRNRLDAVLTDAVGALDRVAEKAPDGELTMGLSLQCQEWLPSSLAAESFPRG